MSNPPTKSNGATRKEQWKEQQLPLQIINCDGHQHDLTEHDARLLV
jgi:hypothetical protein